VGGGEGWGGSSVEPGGGQPAPGGLCGPAGKNRPTTRQPRTGCGRKEKKIVAIKKHPKDISPADDTEARIGNAEHCQRLVEGSAGRIPEKRVIVVRVACDRRDSPG